jgi:Universal stress protein family
LKTEVHRCQQQRQSGKKIVKDFMVSRMRKTLPAERQNRCAPNFLVRFGDPAEEIVQTAREPHASLIALGLRLAEKLPGYPPSPVAYRIVCQAPFPVLTLRR